MVNFYPRSAWTSVPRPVSKLVPQDPSRLRGLAVHYTGSTSPLGDTASLELSKRRLEDERAYHVNGHGWSDLAYLTAIDVEGRVFDCRGILYRCAANGNQTTNTEYGAVTFLLGAGDIPTPAMVEAFQVWRSEVWLKQWPHATAIVGHRDLYQTECPGQPTYELIRSGRILTPTGGDDNMPTPEEYAHAVWSAQLNAGQETLSAQTIVTRTYMNQVTLPELVAALGKAGGADPSVFAQAVINQMGAGFAGEVANEFAKRLVR